MLTNSSILFCFGENIWQTSAVLNDNLAKPGTCLIPFRFHYISEAVTCFMSATNRSSLMKKKISKVKHNLISGNSRNNKKRNLTCCIFVFSFGENLQQTHLLIEQFECDDTLRIVAFSCWCFILAMAWGANLICNTLSFIPVLGPALVLLN